jgi:BASS family bile acid:Na+ symporter
MTSESARSAMVFPACVAGVVAVALAQPDLFGTYAGFDLKRLIVPLIQIIMFGMGATLGVADFVRVARVPMPVAVGMALQFTVMPLVAWGLARAWSFDAEVAAGIILVGSVSGGVASNVITYLAGGNVPLSVSMTLCSTLASPFATPLLMKWLAGRLVPVDVGAMMLSIANMIVLPVAVGLVANTVLFGKAAWNRRGGPLLAFSGAAGALAAGLVLAPWTVTGVVAEIRLGLVLGFGFLALVAAVKWCWTVRCGRTDDWLNRCLPLVSMAGICLIIGIITARAREQLLAVGAALLAVAVLQNFAGYFLGYWGARAARLNERDCRTVAIEVGMQNAGMATGIAMNVLNSTGAALASVIFGPWMNISGALLAGWWKRRPIAGTKAESVRGAHVEPTS